MRALLDSAFFHEIDNLEIAGVICSDPEAPALRSARSSNVPAYVVEEHLFPNIGSYGLALLNMLKDIDTDLVVLAGFTPGLGPAARYYSGRTIGVFPSLIPAFEQMSERQAIQSALVREVRLTGATSYVADDEGRVGHILEQRAVAVQRTDTPETLEDRIFEQAERDLLLDAVKAYCAKAKQAEEAAVLAAKRLEEEKAAAAETTAKLAEEPAVLAAKRLEEEKAAAAEPSAEPAEEPAAETPAETPEEPAAESPAEPETTEE